MKMPFSARRAAIVCCAIASLAFFLYTSVYYVALPILANGGFEPFNQASTWPSSTTPKSNDSLRYVLEMLATSKTNVEDTDGGISSQFIDLNGDGLADFIHLSAPSTTGVGYPSTAVMKNNGNNTFELIYKCVIDAGPTYRGDCAQL